MKSKLLLFAITLGLINSSCNQTNLKRESVWVPIYLNTSDAQKIETLPAKPVSEAGKVYAYRNFIFQLELNKGIHVYRLENKKPVPYKFIQVYGAQEISIKDNYMYTNNFKDIVVLRLDHPEDVTVVNRVANAFDIKTSLPPSKGYFQCVDNTKGALIGWEKQNNVEASCLY